MLFVLAKAPSNELKEASLLLFSAVPSVFGNQNSHYIDVIKQMLLGSLTNSESYDVRFTGVKATANYLLLHEKDATVLKHMAELLGPLLTVRILLFNGSNSFICGTFPNADVTYTFSHNIRSQWNQLKSVMTMLR